MCTQHTILVIDASGSMREADVQSGHHHVSRIDALLNALQGGFILPQLRQLNEEGGGALERELLSVILMCDSEAKTILELAPFQSGASLPPIHPKGHGNYLPALTKLAALVTTLEHCREQGRAWGYTVPPRISTCVFFLSDGRPSDLVRTGSTGGASRVSKIEDAVYELVTRAYRASGEGASAFRLVCVGFGEEDFRVLRGMAAVLPPGLGSFRPAMLDTDALFDTMVTFSTTVTTTRLTSVAGGGGGGPRVLRPVTKIDEHVLAYTAYFAEVAIATAPLPPPPPPPQSTSAHPTRSDEPRTGLPPHLCGCLT